MVVLCFSCLKEWIFAKHIDVYGDMYNKNVPSPVRLFKFNRNIRSPVTSFL